MIVVLPFASPGGTGLGSARKTTPANPASFAEADAEGAAESGSGVGRSQPATKRATKVRQNRNAREIPMVNDRSLFVDMIAFNDAGFRQARISLTDKMRSQPRMDANFPKLFD